MHGRPEIDALTRRQRVEGAAAVGSKRDRRGTTHAHALDTLHQRGSARVRLPRSDRHALSAVLLNTAGGLTGDDAIHWRATAGSDSRLSVATAASEKIYRTHGPAARQSTTLDVGSGARLDWLPQETILFDGARLARTLHATLAADATLLAVEAIAFGRHASGERLHDARLNDSWRVYRDGRLLHAEALRFDAADTPPGVGAMATVLHVRAAGEEALTRLAAELHTLIARHAGPPDAPSGNGAHATLTRPVGGASALDGRIVVRLAAPTSFMLRRVLLPCLERLQGEAALPRVWYV